ncbi:MAG: hypothetical protein JO110_17835, partial [Acetobacteraceae bacterium]|nr:hypothetical protein [Acetobacteraceae bacterium]
DRLRWIGDVEDGLDEALFEGAHYGALECGLKDEDINVSAGHLYKLGCLVPPDEYGTKIWPTPFGFALLRACSQDYGPEKQKAD